MYQKEGFPQYICAAWINVVRAAYNELFDAFSTQSIDVEPADALEIRAMDPQVAAWAADIAKYDDLVAQDEYSEARQEAIRDGDRLLTRVNRLRTTAGLASVPAPDMTDAPSTRRRWRKRRAD